MPDKDSDMMSTCLPRTRRRLLTLAQVRTVAFPPLCTLYLGAIYGLPLVAIAALWTAHRGLLWHGAVAVLTPLLYSGLLVTVAGLLSQPHQCGIIPGTFPRQLSHPIYFHRRLYGLCWTALYYCTPVYHLVLALPWLKTLTLRLFGYRGSLDVTLYPDTWIRDLPLLRLGAGVYVANRATLGTNMVLHNGRIVVDTITLEENVLVGHLSMIGPGVQIAAGTEVGAACGIGYKTRIGVGSTIGAMTGIDHGVRIGAHVRIGARSAIGRRATLADGVVLPRATLVPAAETVRSLRPGPSPVNYVGYAVPALCTDRY